MSNPISLDLFLEDRAHEEFLVPLVQRIAREEKIPFSERVRSARGGHGRALSELRLYQTLVTKGFTSRPDLLIVGIDGNCKTFAKAKKAIEGEVLPSFSAPLVVACPDPHVERWYLADPEFFKAVVGRAPPLGKKKCDRGHYKGVLANTVRKAGHPLTLGGIEFARDLVRAMDLFRAGKNDRSLKAFVDNLRSSLRTLRPLERERPE